MRKRRSHATPVLVLAVVYVGVGVLTYSLTLGAIDYLLGLNAANKEPGIPFGPLAYSRSGYEFFVWDRFVEAIAGVWFFALGASIGSFLNVVACRLPLNKGLVREGSSCPYCLRPILLRDNIPILSWLALRGRCRVCRLPISIRYPTVEVLTGLIFLWLFWTELAVGGEGLPNSWLQIDTSVGDLILDARWDLVGLFFFHAFIVCVIWTAALMTYDRQSPPASFWFFSVLSTYAFLAIWPTVYSYIVDWFGGYPLVHVTLFPVPSWPVSGIRPLEFRNSLTDVVSALFGTASGLLASVLVVGNRRPMSSRVTPEPAEPQDDLKVSGEGGDLVEEVPDEAQWSPRAVVRSGAPQKETSEELRGVYMGMLVMIGLGWGWQFLLGVLLIWKPVFVGLRMVVPRLRQNRQAALAFGLCLSVLCLLTFWDAWHQAWTRIPTMVERFAEPMMF